MRLGLLLTLMVCLGVASVATAAPTVIGTPVAADSDAAAATSLTFSATCPNTGTNRVAIACINVNRGSGSPVSVTSYTWNGVAMTSLGTADAAGTASALMYLLKNPTCDGAAHNAVITLAASPSHYIVGNIAFFQDVDQTTSTDTVATATGTAPSITVNVSSAVGDFVVDCVASRNSNTNITKDASQTLESFDQTTHLTAANNIEGGMSSETGAATVTMSWSGGVVDWAQVGVSVNPVSATTRRRGGAPYRFLKSPMFTPSVGGFPFFYGAVP